MFIREFLFTDTILKMTVLPKVLEVIKYLFFNFRIYQSRGTFECISQKNFKIMWSKVVSHFHISNIFGLLELLATPKGLSQLKFKFNFLTKR